MVPRSPLIEKGCGLFMVWLMLFVHMGARHSGQSYKSSEDQNEYTHLVVIDRLYFWTTNRYIRIIDLPPVFTLVAQLFGRKKEHDPPTHALRSYWPTSEGDSSTGISSSFSGCSGST